MTYINKLIKLFLVLQIILFLRFLLIKMTQIGYILAYIYEGYCNDKTFVFIF